MFYAHEVFHAGCLYVGPDGGCDHLYVWVHRHTGTNAAAATVYLAGHFQRGRSERAGVDCLDLAKAAPASGDGLVSITRTSPNWRPHERRYTKLAL